MNNKYFCIIILLFSLKLFSQTEITVSNSLELIKNLKSNATIKLEEGTYYISPRDTILIGVNEHYVESEENRWFPMYFQNFENLKIVGLGKVEIKSKNPSYFVMAFRNCSGLTIENITIGHEVNEECSGGTVHFENTKDIQISNSTIYGSGVIGLDIDFSSDIKVFNTRIYDCSKYIINIANSKNIYFKDSKLEDSKLNKVIYLFDTENISFKDCVFRNLTQKEYITESPIFLYTNVLRNEVIFENTLFENNFGFEYFSNKRDYLYKNCKFENSDFNHVKENNHFQEGIMMYES